MVYTQVASRDAKRGVMIISDTLDDLCEDLLEWIKESSPIDLLPADIISREDSKVIGKISFKEDTLIIDPA